MFKRIKLSSTGTRRKFPCRVFCRACMDVLADGFAGFAVDKLNGRPLMTSRTRIRIHRKIRKIIRKRERNGYASIITSYVKVEIFLPRTGYRKLLPTLFDDSWSKRIEFSSIIDDDIIDYTLPMCYYHKLVREIYYRYRITNRSRVSFQHEPILLLDDLQFE